MGTYLIIRIKDQTEKAIKAANESIKQFGAKYETFNGVEYGYFRTSEMTKEDCRYMNEDPEGMKQDRQQKRPITPEHLSSYFWMERGAYVVKISSLNREEEKDIEIIKAWITSGKGYDLIDIKKSEYLERIVPELVEQTLLFS